MSISTAAAAPKPKYTYGASVAHDTAAGRVLRLTMGARSVLELGAGPGSITRPLIEQGGADVTALEVDPQSVAILKQFCSKVVGADLNATGWADNFNGETFDAIVAADVLEHLLDPLTTLKAMKSLLTADGHIVLSLPHAGHAGILAALWGEDFAYADQGLLDRTHLRWFGLKNMQDLVEAAGLTIVEAELVQTHPEKTELSAAWRRLPWRVQRAIQVNKFSNVYQVVMKLKPRESAFVDGDAGVQLMYMKPKNYNMSLFKLARRRLREWRRK